MFHETQLIIDILKNTDTNQIQPPPPHVHMKASWNADLDAEYVPYLLAPEIAIDIPNAIKLAEVYTIKTRFAAERSRNPIDKRTKTTAAWTRTQRSHFENHAQNIDNLQELETWVRTRYYKVPVSNDYFSYRTISTKRARSKIMRTVTLTVNAYKGAHSTQTTYLSHFNHRKHLIIQDRNGRTVLFLASGIEEHTGILNEVITAATTILDPRFVQVGEGENATMHAVHYQFMNRYGKRVGAISTVGFQ
jgi:hypothetical protein